MRFDVLQFILQMLVKKDSSNDPWESITLFKGYSYGGELHHLTGLGNFEGIIFTLLSPTFTSYLQKSKRPGFYALVFYIFINNWRSKQNKKNPQHPFLDIAK